MAEDLASRIAVVRGRIRTACERAGRSPDDVTLIAVSKTHDTAAIGAAFAAGVYDFGENRVQEAATKVGPLRAAGTTPRWHFIGHLQSNKVADAIDLFDILHSVDSVHLAEAISRRTMHRVKVLMEVNVAGEASKFGAALADVSGLAEGIGSMPGLDLVGLMTVAPQVDDPESVRPVFRTLRQLRDAVGLRELSMGMTDDFEVAVEEGATLVRVGRALFGERAPQTPGRA